MKINLKTNEKNIITSYAIIGKIDGGIDVETNYEIEDVPPLSIGYYKLKDGKIEIDEELKAQINSDT